MGDVGKFFRRRFGFLVSSPRRRYANRVGLVLGWISIVITSILFAYSVANPYFCIGSGFCILFMVPIIVFFNFFNFSEGVIVNLFIGFLVYYAIGYGLGLFSYWWRSLGVERKKN
jgi:hypothetical protein